MKKLLLFLGLIAIYNLLFWHQHFGINQVIFFLVAIGVNLNRETLKNLKPLDYFLFFAVLSTSVATIFINSSMSKWMLSLSFIACMANLIKKESSVYESLFNGFLNFLNYKEPVVPLPKIQTVPSKWRGVLSVRIALVPLTIIIIYFFLFSAGNSVFREMNVGLFEWLGEVFGDISATYVLFVLLGIFIVRWIIIQKGLKGISLRPTNQLNSNEIKVKAPHLAKQEHIIALIVFSMLNLLYLVVNFIDVKLVWFQFEVPMGFSLKSFVHEGVGWLIFTLIVSIGLILYYFRGGLNFIKNNSSLKVLTYMWIAQNMVLAVSVFLRTWYYIDFHGLASKRIGVLIFLMMVGFGLLSLIYKIHTQRNMAFMMRSNSAFIMATLVVASFFPWDKMIATYNLGHHNINEIEVDNYLRLDPQVYPLIYEQLHNVDRQISAHQYNKTIWINYNTIEEFKEELNRSARIYLDSRKDLSVASWTLADQRAIRQLEEHLAGEPLSPTSETRPSEVF